MNRFVVRMKPRNSLLRLLGLGLVIGPVLGSVLGLAACDGPSQKVQPARAEPMILNTHARFYAEPPGVVRGSDLNLVQQANGAFTALRNQALSKGYSLQDCRNLMIYVRQDGLGPDGWRKVERVKNRYFGTPLVPNSPPVHMMAVQGFANPSQLLLVEADFSH